MAIINPISASVPLETGGVPDTSRDQSIARGLEGFGARVQQAGEALGNNELRLLELENKRKRFGANMQLRALDETLRTEVFELLGNMDPSGSGHVGAVEQLVNKRYDEFFQGLRNDPWLQTELAPDLDVARNTFIQQAARDESKQRQGWYSTEIDRAVDVLRNDVFNNPELLPAALDDAEDLIATSGLWKAEAEAKRRQVRAQLQIAAGERFIADGDVSKLSLLGIASPDNAEAAALIRGFEGLTTRAYADTRTSTGKFDAWRTGYGSDTVTLSDGTVQAVTQATRITPEDAERDLTRRIGEFQATIIRQVGVDAWAALPPSARAGLTSVAYNYGSLPSSVVGAVKGGDVNSIAAAVASLDANPGRRKREAAAILGGMEPAPEFADVPFDVRRQLYDRLAAAGKATIETAVSNAPAAIANTGNYTGTMPTAHEFVAAYGPKDGADRFREFEASIEVARTAHTMQTMPQADIMALLEAYRPKSSGTDAALETARFDMLQKAAAGTIAARNEDPATYTRRAFPEVEKAWQEYQRTDLPPDQRPAAYQAALTATQAAQERLGVTRPVLLPAPVAAAAVTRFKDAEAVEAERVSAVADLLIGAKDPALQQAIFRQLVDAGLPEHTAGAMDALVRGDHAAAQRLFQAALLDPTKLPGDMPETPARIDDVIQAELMDDGRVGSIFYGLDDGDALNYERALGDRQLMLNAVRLRLVNGEPLDQAVRAVGKDLFGDVQVVEGRNVSALVEANVDPGPVRTGFLELLPRVREALTARSVVPADLPVADSSRAVFDAAERNQIEAILEAGYFRNSGDGFVFIDPFDGVAVEDQTGNSLTFTLDQVLAAANAAPPPQIEDTYRRMALEGMFPELQQ
jgi:GH24 family phage-related lysozyme (muramidase)